VLLVLITITPLEVLCYSILLLILFLALLDKWGIASPANLIEVIVFKIALFGTVFGAPRIFLYMPASKRSISYLFHRPAAASGVPM
jgi:hypothetical protein